MEIRHFWNIIMRRWWVAAIVFVLAAAYGAYQWKAGGNLYTAEVKLVVRQLTPQAENGVAATGVYTYDSYYRYYSSEYLVDDFDEVVKGRVFADAVAQTMKGDSTKYGANSPDGNAIYSTIGASRIHRIMTLVATTDDPDSAYLTANAAAATLVKEGGNFLPPDVRDDVGFITIDYPKSAGEAKSNASKKLTTGVIIALLGLIVGLALVFMLDYLDDRVRDVGDATRTTGLSVLGRIPTRGNLPLSVGRDAEWASSN